MTERHQRHRLAPNQTPAPARWVVVAREENVQSTALHVPLKEFVANTKKHMKERKFLNPLVFYRSETSYHQCQFLGTFTLDTRSPLHPLKPSPTPHLYIKVPAAY